LGLLNDDVVGNGACLAVAGAAGVVTAVDRSHPSHTVVGALGESVSITLLDLLDDVVEGSYQVLEVSALPTVPVLDRQRRSVVGKSCRHHRICFRFVRLSVTTGRCCTDCLENTVKVVIVPCCGGNPIQFVEQCHPAMAEVIDVDRGSAIGVGGVLLDLG